MTGALNLIGVVVVMLMVSGLLAAFGLQVLGDIQGGMTGNSSEANATGEIITGISNLTGQFGNIGTIAAVVVIVSFLGLLYAYARGVVR